MLGSRLLSRVPFSSVQLRNKMALYATPDPRVPAWLYSCDGLFAGALQPRGQLSSSVWRQHVPPSGQAERGESLEGWECEVVFITGASTCFAQHWLHLSQQLQVPSGTPALHQPHAQAASSPSTWSVSPHTKAGQRHSVKP